MDPDDGLMKEGVHQPGSGLSAWGWVAAEEGCTICAVRDRNSQCLASEVLDLQLRWHAEQGSVEEHLEFVNTSNRSLLVGHSLG